MKIQAGWIHGQAGITDCSICVGALASQLTGGADIDTAAAEATFLRTGVKRSRDFSFVSAILKANSSSIHLLSAHPDTQAAENTFFVANFEPYLFYSKF
jgi:hypothetical protein